MGVIKPQWITLEWFSQCPYNYCDHFGDKTILARVCRFCKEDLIREKTELVETLDPFEIQFVIVNIPRTVSEILIEIESQAQILEIVLEEKEMKVIDPEFGNFTIYKNAIEYGELVEQILNVIDTLPGINHIKLIKEVKETLAHSRFYVQVKIHRAVVSKVEEQNDPENDLFDSKTSALVAYLAVMRNSQIIIKLTNELKLSVYTKKSLLEFALLSIKLAEVIRNKFFPLELTFEELSLERLN